MASPARLSDLALPASPRARIYRLADKLHLERFGDDCLLLVEANNLLLTVNAAAADLLETAQSEFTSRHFTLADVSAGLTAHYRLPTARCHEKARDLLAFGLKYHLVLRVAPSPVCPVEAGI